MKELTAEGKKFLEAEFDTLEDAKNNWFPERSIDEIILACNVIGSIHGSDITDLMEIFFEGMDHGKGNVPVGVEG